MARTGLLYPVYAPVSTYTEGSAITYGTGAVLCHAIEANITYNRRDNPLYADDYKVENDKGLTGYTIAFTGDRLPNDKRAALLNETVLTTGTAPNTTVTGYRVTDTNPPYVGFGYIVKALEDNVVKYEAYWFWRVQFSLDNENAHTKEENISWGTYPMTGTGFGAVIESGGDVVFFDHMNFGTESAAKSWLNSKAGIT